MVYNTAPAPVLSVWGSAEKFFPFLAEVGACIQAMQGVRMFEPIAKKNKTLQSMGIYQIY